MNKTNRIGFQYKPIAEDMDGNDLRVGDRVLFLESYTNELRRGTIVTDTGYRIKIDQDNENWPRLICKENSKRMILKLGDEDQLM